MGDAHILSYIKSNNKEISIPLAISGPDFGKDGVTKFLKKNYKT